MDENKKTDEDLVKRLAEAENGSDIEGIPNGKKEHFLKLLESFIQHPKVGRYRYCAAHSVVSSYVGSFNRPSDPNFIGDTDLTVKWDEKKEVFSIRVVQETHGLISMEEFFFRIPVKIAELSKCECGAKLTLGSYEAHKHKEGYSLQADYFCSSCKIKTTKRDTSVKAFIRKGFDRIKRIKVSPTGLEIEQK